MHTNLDLSYNLHRPIAFLIYIYIYIKANNIIHNTLNDYLLSLTENTVKTEILKVIYILQYLKKVGFKNYSKPLR